MRVLEISKKELQKLYQEKRMSTREIGQRLGFTHKTILKKLRKYNIRVRHGNGGRKRINIPRNRLERMYNGKEMTTYEIGRRLNVSHTTICNRMKEHNIPRRRAGKRGGV